MRIRINKQKMKKKRISNLQKLEKEIARKKFRSKEIEKTLDFNMEFLKDNYRSMAIRSVIGSGRGGSRELLGDVAVQFLGSPKLHDGLATLVEMLAERIGTGITRARRRVREKRSDKS
jgi:hypothetical protein